MELKISSCIWDVDFELLNTEFIVDLCFGFRKPNSCVGFTGLDLNSFGTTMTSLQTGFDSAVQVVNLLGSGSIRNVESFMEKDKVYVRSSSVRLIFVTDKMKTKGNR